MSKISGQFQNTFGISGQLGPLLMTITASSSHSLRSLRYSMPPWNFRQWMVWHPSLAGYYEARYVEVIKAVHPALVRFLSVSRL